jgi:hypothetical protein
LNGFEWMKSLFKSEKNEEELINQLESKLNVIEILQEIGSSFILKVEEAKIKLSIRSISGV